MAVTLAGAVGDRPDRLRLRARHLRRTTGRAGHRPDDDEVVVALQHPDPALVEPVELAVPDDREDQLAPLDQRARVDAEASAGAISRSAISRPSTGSSRSANR